MPVSTLVSKLTGRNLFSPSKGDPVVVPADETACGSTGEATAETLAEELRASVAATPLLDGRPITVSIGVAELRPDDTVESWIKRADDDMYAAKNAMRNRVARSGAAAAVMG